MTKFQREQRTLWLRALRDAHANGHHGNDVSGYWKSVGCVICEYRTHNRRFGVGNAPKELRSRYLEFYNV